MTRVAPPSPADADRFAALIPRVLEPSECAALIAAAEAAGFERSWFSAQRNRHAALDEGVAHRVWEGVRDHVAKARALSLPHVRFFDEAFDKGWTTPVAELMECVDELLAMDATAFASKEWRFSAWRKDRHEAAAYETARCGTTYAEWAGTRARNPSLRAVGACAAAVALLSAAVALTTSASRRR